MKNIVILLNSFPPGGVSRLVSIIAKNIDPKRFHISIAAFGIHQAYAQRLGVQVTNLNESSIAPGGYFESSHLAEKFLSACKPDLVVTFIAYPSPHLTAAAARCGIPLLIFMPTDLHKHLTQLTRHMPDAVFRTYQKMAHKNIGSAEGVMTHGSHVAEKLRDKYQCEIAGLLPNMPHEINETFIHRKRIPGRIVSIGRLSPEKGHEHLIRAAVKLEGVDIRIIGNGPEHTWYEKLIDRLQVRDRIKIEAFTNDSDALASLSKAELFVLPSLYETMSAVVLDAMAVQIPILATKVGEIPDLLADIYPLAEPNNPDSLQKNISRMLGTDYTSSVIKAAERANEFCIKTIISQWEMIFEKDWRATEYQTDPEDMRSLAEVFIDTLGEGGEFDLYGSGSLAGEFESISAGRGVLFMNRYDRISGHNTKSINSRPRDTPTPLVVASLYFSEIRDELKSRGIESPIYQYPGHY